jgi:hypothetical protein
MKPVDFTQTSLTPVSSLRLLGRRPGTRDGAIPLNFSFFKAAFFPIMIAALAIGPGLTAAPGNSIPIQDPSRPDSDRFIKDVEQVDALLDKGEFSQTGKWIELKLQNKSAWTALEIKIWEKYLADIKAVKREYPLSYADVFKELRALIPDLSERDMRKWEEDHSLEFHLIDGEKKYFSYCLPDLFKLNREAAGRAKIPARKTGDAARYPQETITSFENGVPLSKKIDISFGFFQDMGSLPDRTLLRAWIPYVRSNRFQSRIKIVRSSVENFVLPKDDGLTSMIYFEKVMDKKNNANREWARYWRQPSPSWISPFKKAERFDDSFFICHFVYEFESAGYYKNINPQDIRPGRIANPEFAKYTRETENNRFTLYLMKLSSTIIGPETNDYLKAKKIYQWICENIIWTVAKPVVGDYAEYTAKYKSGDCGAKANLFISLCRLNHIPARPQAGWRVEPDGAHSQHGWAQVYFEPLGWLPVDPDAGSHLIHHTNDKIKFFYFGNRTPYRMIIDDDGTALVPEKKFECLYGGGSQLGAFEWSGGDIEPNIVISSRVEEIGRSLSQSAPKPSLRRGNAPSPRPERPLRADGRKRPGESHYYSGAGDAIIEQLIEGVAGRTYQESRDPSLSPRRSPAIGG